jgi:hypothetical protein
LAVARPLPLAKTGTERVEGPDVRWDRVASSAASSLSNIYLIFLDNLGNGVTVAYRVLGQAVDFPEGVLQLAPFLVRFFPDTSEPFAKPPTVENR